MKIKVASLRDGPLVYDVDLSPRFLEGGIEEDLRFDPGRGSVTFQIVGTEVLAAGELSTTAYATCARCLTQVACPISVRVHLYYWPRQKENAPEGETEIVDPMEPDCAYYDNDVIEPDEDLRELLVVEVPSVVHCKEDCKGLCPRCGTNLNESTCSCSAEEEAQRTESDRSSETFWKSQLKNLDLE